MIGQIIRLLNISEFYSEGECIEIAKGKYKLEPTLYGKVKQKQRARLWRLKK